MLPPEEPGRYKPREERRRERQNQREIKRNFGWRSGHDPNDDDAHPDSGWEYAKVVEEPEKPQGPPVDAHGTGVRSGMPCLQAGCGLDLFIIQSFEPKEILGYLETVDIVIPKVEDRVVVLKCANEHAVQMRESLLPIKTRLGL